MDIDDTHAIFKHKFPRLKDEMEHQLINYLDKYSEESIQYSDSNANFARHQILEYTCELLDHSQNDRLTKDALICFSENVEHTLSEVCELLLFEKEGKITRPQCCVWEFILM